MKLVHELENDPHKLEKVKRQFGLDDTTLEWLVCFAQVMGMDIAPTRENGKITNLMWTKIHP